MSYDFFISHASEDKEPIALPIYKVLTQLGFKVWFDRAQISMGDSIVDKIQDGLSHSKYGIVILSKNFFAKKKNWTKRELDAFLMRDISIKNTILPIWHKVDLDYVLEHSPFLASKYAISSDKGIEDVAREILKKAEIDNVVPPPIQLLAFLWRPSYTMAFRTRGADVFCIVSKLFFEPKVYLNLHSPTGEVTKNHEMTFYRDISQLFSPVRSYNVYSTFLDTQGASLKRFSARASVTALTDYGEFSDDNRGSFYLTDELVPEFINYNAFYSTGRSWMGENVRLWTHSKEELKGYSGRPFNESE